MNASSGCFDADEHLATLVLSHVEVGGGGIFAETKQKRCSQKLCQKPSPTPPPPHARTALTSDLPLRQPLNTTHVQDLHTLLALACVDTTWRKVATRPGVCAASSSLCSWRTCLALGPREELVLDGALAAKLTDSLVKQLLTCAGPHLRSLAVRGASAEFTGSGLCDYVSLANQRFMYVSWWVLYTLNPLVEPQLVRSWFHKPLF